MRFTVSTWKRYILSFPTMIDISHSNIYFPFFLCISISDLSKYMTNNIPLSWSPKYPYCTLSVRILKNLALNLDGLLRAKLVFPKQYFTAVQLDEILEIKFRLFHLHGEHRVQLSGLFMQFRVLHQSIVLWCTNEVQHIFSFCCTRLL